VVVVPVVAAVAVAVPVAAAAAAAAIPWQQEEDCEDALECDDRNGETGASCGGNKDRSAAWRSSSR